MKIKSFLHFDKISLDHVNTGLKELININKTFQSTSLAVRFIGYTLLLNKYSLCIAGLTSYYNYNGIHNTYIVSVIILKHYATTY